MQDIEEILDSRAEFTIHDEGARFVVASYRLDRDHRSELAASNPAFTRDRNFSA